MSPWAEDSALIGFLRSPKGAVERFSGEDWQILLREARRGNLLGRVASFIDRDGLWCSVPPSLADHFSGALRVAAANARSVRWEVKELHEALSGAQVPFALLKGSAYLVAGSDASSGRVFGDIDILVRERDLRASERALIKAGWFSTKLDAYDQRYYREWMHELPPMRHLKRQTDLDVHHAILPPTARDNVDMQAVWAAIQPIEDWPGVYLLSPCDRIIHSATHFFYEGELEQGLRDLVDLDALCREALESMSCFWDTLFGRAVDVGLETPLLAVVNLCRELLGTPVDGRYVVTTPRSLGEYATRWAHRRAVIPRHLDQRQHGLGVAHAFLYLRGHYLRMPLRLLLPHLARKLFASEGATGKRTPSA